MKPRYDPWYLRLPDGRVVTAKSTSSVRHHVEAGNIPLNSMARRHSYEEWVDLAWIAEFADLGSGRERSSPSEPDEPLPLSNGNGSSPESDIKRSVAARLDPMRLQIVGIRGLVDELIAAFDSAIGAGKGIFACIVLSIGVLLLFVGIQAVRAVYPEGIWLSKLIAGLAAALIMSVVVAVLTRQTHLELSTMRPVRLAEAQEGIGAFIFRVFLGYAATVGVCIGTIVLLQYVPEWLVKSTGSMSFATAEALYTAVWATSLALAVVLFIFVLLALLLPPILIVEECSVGDALREWRSVLREHRIRVLVYEGLAITFALVAALPLALPVYLAEHYLPLNFSYNWVTAAVPLVLHAIVAGPALTFLAVANLYIYLNLRYEYSPTK